MEASSSFWEVFQSSIVFVLINARSKLNYCAMSHVTHLGESLLPDCHPLPYSKIIYYSCSLIKCVYILILSVI